jgi:DNA-binding SARP family transcriptional activator/predicted ATPase
MPLLHIQLLGDFRLTVDGVLLTTVVQARMQSLLAYLLLHRETPVLRQRIAFLFWPETGEPQAYTNLRQILHRLRRALPESDQFLQVNAKTVQWRTDAAFTLDIAEYENSMDQAASAAKEERPDMERIALESAIQQYGGSLLEGLYDDWILPERERLSQAFIGALERVIFLAETQRDYRAAIQHAEHLLRHDPLAETTYQCLMRLHVLNGDRASALRTYHTCVTTLAEELGVEPNVETQEAYQQLLNLNTQANLRSSYRTVPEARSALVGRHHEWNTLRKAWRHAASGRPTLAVIAGEAGIGKTRLAEELLDWAAQQGIMTARTRSYAAEGQLAYAPVIELFRTAPIFTRLSGLENIWVTELARLMPELFAEQPALPRPEPVGDPWQRQRLFEALTRALLSDKKPLLLLLDDLQWCDQDTLEWLHYLLHFDQRSRLLILAGVRPEEIDPEHPLTALLLDLRLREQVIEIILGPLEAGDARALAEQTGGRKLDTDQAARLYSYTEGNPLFVIETVRTQVDSGDISLPIEHSKLEANSLPLSSKEMPAKIQAIIQARLRLLSPEARDAASHAATIGRAFTSDVLAQAMESDEESLVRGLDELWWRRIIREQGGNIYYFSHDRIREAAYDQMSPARRKLLHRRAALALETVYAEELDPVSGQIAVHYEQAGEFALAISYYQRAAGAAQQMFSNAEVVDLIGRALALLQLLPDTNERSRAELSLLITLGTAQMMIQGYSHPIVEHTFLHAWNLYQIHGEEDQTIPVLAGLWISYHLRGEQTQAMVWAKRLEQGVKKLDNGWFHAIAQFALAGVSLFRGDFTAVIKHAERGFHLSDPHQLHFQGVKLGYEPGIWAFGYWSQSLWFLGYPDQARMKVQEMLRLAYQFNQPISIGYALSMSTVLHQLCGEVHLTLEQAAATIDYAQGKGLQQWIIHGRILAGWALAHGGRVEQGCEQIKEGIETWKAMGARLALTYYLLLLAETCTISGQIEEGLDAVAEALLIAQTGEESVWEAELYRRQGELLLLQGAGEQRVEACFRKALEIARSQQARSIELRAALSLNRLFQNQDQQANSRSQLDALYGWFAEGFDTADLRQAQKLLVSIQP